jgi:VRR-NUC domain-containing protein
VTAARPLLERDFQRQVTDLAGLRGWSWLHIRAGRTADSWRTPISGPLGKGWPDLVLVRPRDSRLIFAELKREGGTLRPEQDDVLVVLAHLDSANATGPGRQVPFTQVFVWTPADWPQIEQVLR